MNMIVKATAAAAEGMEFVLSDGTVDSYGDIVEPTGWDLRRFRKNPIALFGHSSGFPIGTWTNVRVEDGKLKGRLEMARQGTSFRIDELRKLVEQGILRAVSVGFRPLKAEPISPDRPGGGMRYLKSELMEASLVSVPANPAALSLAKGLNLSDETLDLVFGKSAEADVIRRDTSGKPADPLKPHARKEKSMKTLSERVQDAQQTFTQARDAYHAHVAEDDFDIGAAEGLEANMKEAEDRLTALQRAEKALAARATPAGHGPVAAQARKAGDKDVKGLDLLVRAAVVRGTAHFGGMSIDQALEMRYPGHEATELVVKADQTIGTTTGSHWADDLVQTAYGDFMQALTGFSVYPALASRGVKLSFDQNGSVLIPGRTAGGAGGGFFAEGSPIRVGKITTTSTTVTSKQMGVIIAFSRKLARQSTPAVEAIVRQAILEDTAAVLDPILLDATASSTERPAGLLYGVPAAAPGYGGGDHMAVVEDFKALLAPFIAANATDNITVIMNPKQGLSIDFMVGPDGVLGDWFSRVSRRVTFVESTHATAGRLIAIRNSDFATATGDTPMFDISEQAVLHMEDTTPLEIVSGTGPTTADPVRSLWQTGTIGVRMIMDIVWQMRRTGMVQWIDGTSW